MRSRPSLVLLLLALAGCRGAASPGGGSCKAPAEIGPLQGELDAKNRESLESARARALGTAGYTQITPATVNTIIPGLSPGYEAPRDDRSLPTVIAAGPERGLLPSERIVATPSAENAPSKIVFGTTECSAGSSCGCTLRPEYRFASAAGGRVVILRLNPRIQHDEVLQCGPCGVGCGVPPPPPTPATYALPVEDGSKVDIVDVPYEWRGLRVRCESEIPAP